MVFDAGLLPNDLEFGTALLRVRRGPSVADRAIAADVALYGVIGAITVLMLRQEAYELMDVVLVATLLGFLATVALSLLVGRRGT